MKILTIILLCISLYVSMSHAKTLTCYASSSGFGSKNYPDSSETTKTCDADTPCILYHEENSRGLNGTMRGCVSDYNTLFKITNGKPLPMETKCTTNGGGVVGFGSSYNMFCTCDYNKCNDSSLKISKSYLLILISFFVVKLNF